MNPVECHLVASPEEAASHHTRLLGKGDLDPSHGSAAGRCTPQGAGGSADLPVTWEPCAFARGGGPRARGWISRSGAHGGSAGGGHRPPPRAGGDRLPESACSRLKCSASSPRPPRVPFRLEAVKAAAARPASRCCPTASLPPPPTSRLLATSMSQVGAGPAGRSASPRGCWGVPTPSPEILYTQAYTPPKRPHGCFSQSPTHTRETLCTPGHGFKGVASGLTVPPSHLLPRPLHARGQ